MTPPSESGVDLNPSNCSPGVTSRRSQLRHKMFCTNSTRGWRSRHRLTSPIHHNPLGRRQELGCATILGRQSHLQQSPFLLAWLVEPRDRTLGQPTFFTDGEPLRRTSATAWRDQAWSLQLTWRASGCCPASAATRRGLSAGRKEDSTRHATHRASPAQSLGFRGVG